MEDIGNLGSGLYLYFSDKFRENALCPPPMTSDALPQSSALKFWHNVKIWPTNRPIGLACYATCVCMVKIL